MKLIEQLKDRVTNLLTAPLDEVGRWARFVRFQIQLWRFCAGRLRKNNAMAMSSALSFRTLFALIPALVLALVILKPLGRVETTQAGIEKALKVVALDQIVVSEGPKAAPGQPTGTQGPPKVVKLAETIERLVTSVERKLTFGRIGPVGVLVLIWSVLTLLTTMERSLNRIFNARRVRSLGKRVLLYWSVVTLCPLLLVTAVYLGGVAAEVLRGIPVISWMLSAVGWMGPVVVGIALLATVYKLMPNTAVSFNTALVGATVAVPLWLVAKWGFGLYVFNLVGRGSLYGTLGLLPVFLLWLNLSWLLFLFGATIAHTAANLSAMRAAEAQERFVPTSSAMLAAAAAVAVPFSTGTGPVPAQQVAGKLRLPTENAEWLLERLIAIRVVSRVDSAAEPAYVLARPADRIPLTEILEIDGCREADRPADYDPEVADVLARFRQRACGSFGKLTLADIVAADESS